MEIKLYRPSDPVLQPYIECFYTLTRTADEPQIKYLAFPSIYSMVCLNAQANVEVSNRNLTFYHGPGVPLWSSLICDYKSPGLMTYNGLIDEIVIYFKPLAINAFLDGPLSAYTDSFFTPFEPYLDHHPTMLEIFTVESSDQRVELLEKYWRSKLRGFEHPFLHGVMAELLSEDFSGSISDLAARHGISRTTLVKHFDRYVRTTPSQFRKVARFRAAMKRHREKLRNLNLSDISHETDYFDQSHMIKDFRSLTKLPPKAFFSRLSTLEDGQINWQFI